MFRNYFKIIGRNLWRNKLYTLINIIGLGVGIATIVWGFQNYRFSFSYDNFHKDKECIFRALIKVAGSDDLKGPCPMPLATFAKNDFPGVKETVRWDGRPLNIKAEGGEALASQANFTDPAFFNLFSFPLLRGAIDLNNRSTVVITERSARRFFGDTDPIGKTLLFYSDQTYKKPLTVTGILKDPPANSTIQFDNITDIDNRLRPDGSAVKEDDWSWFADAVFLKLAQPGQAVRLQENFRKYLPFEQSARRDIKVTSIVLEPILQVANQSGYIDKNALDQRPQDAAAYVPLILGILVLLSACLNFANTTVAQSNRRLKEIGMRKVMGSSFRQIMGQQLLECALIVLLAIGFSALINLYWLPAFNAMFGYIHLTAQYWNDHTLLLFLAALFLGVTLLAGAYPAFYISRFNATNIFRGSVKFGGRNLFSRGLLGLQIAISFITVIASVAFSRNASFQRDYDYGYTKANVMGLNLQKESAYTTVRDELNKTTGIEQIAGTRDQIGFSYHTWSLGANGTKKECTYLDVGEHYTELMGLKLVAGRNFHPSGTSDYGRSMLINEKLAFAFGWRPAEAIGQQIRKDDSTVCTVVGVLRDFTQNSFFDPIAPVAICLVTPEQCTQLIIRTKPGTLDSVYNRSRAVWSTLYPLQPFSGYYQDEIGARAIYSNKMVAGIFSRFALISIFLAATGLFALVSLTVLKKTKEIAIRKVVGANGRHIFRLVLRGYSWLFLLSAALGCYAGYSLSRLMMDLIFRINAGVSLSSLTISFTGVLLISAGTIGARVWLVLRTKATEVLKGVV
ncbi:MAG TPA: ABC transporter permease [Puia sp.]|nr:ABC transporter permease [Puia sp.]